MNYKKMYLDIKMNLKCLEGKAEKINLALEKLKELERKLINKVYRASDAGKIAENQEVKTYLMTKKESYDKALKEIANTKNLYLKKIATIKEHFSAFKTKDISSAIATCLNKNREGIHDYKIIKYVTNGLIDYNGLIIAKLDVLKQLEIVEDKYEFIKENNLFILCQSKNEIDLEETVIMLPRYDVETGTYPNGSIQKSNLEFDSSTLPYFHSCYNYGVNFSGYDEILSLVHELVEYNIMTNQIGNIISTNKARKIR